MKTQAFLLTTAFATTLATVTSVEAGHRNADYQNYSKSDYAKVVNVEPITKTIRVNTPRQECWQEEVAHERPRYNKNHHRSATPVLLGSIIGGVIGNELGNNKDAKRAGVVAGALLGGSIGRDIGRRYNNQHGNYHASDVYYTTEEVCKTYNDVHHEERVVGYQVAYKYHGHTYYTETQEHPGKRIRVNVSVTPAEY